MHDFIERVQKNKIVRKRPILTSIVVASHNNFNKKVLHSALVLVTACVITTPAQAHAGIVSSFTDKVKSVFMPKNEMDDATNSIETSQTISLFKPVVIDDKVAQASDSSVSPDASSTPSLKAVSGTLRVSTEDADFPTNDTISAYEVKKGDTLDDVAKLFHVSKNTIIWANDLKSQRINPGDTLVILPMTGTVHIVKKGDTVTSIAKKYKADAQDIALYNGVAIGATLTVGDTILVPEGEVEAPTPTKPKSTSGRLSKNIKEKLLDSYSLVTDPGFLFRPLAGGTKTQGLHGHNAVDIAAPVGTPVFASVAGTVIVAKTGGYNGGYGNMIVIQHENNIQTVYGHLHSVSVSAGETVTQGQQIGLVGNTGKSTGPHLHFEVRGAKNPF